MVVEAKCAKCGAAAYLSRRRGLQEGILLRFMLYAVFRCSHCSMRWSEYLPSVAFKKTRRSETFSEYIGWGDAKGQQKLIRVLLVTVVVIVLGAAFMSLRRPVLRIRLNEQGQVIPDPKPSKLLPPHR